MSKASGTVNKSDVFLFSFPQLNRRKTSRRATLQLLLFKNKHQFYLIRLGVVNYRCIDVFLVMNCLFSFDFNLVDYVSSSEGLNFL